MPKTDIRGLNVDNVTMDEALEIAKKALFTGTFPALVFTPNAEIAQACAENAETLSLINSADLILPDGAGILRAARILGTPLKEKVAGVDFGDHIAYICGNSGKKLYILGGKPSVAEAAANRLRDKYKGLDVAGYHDGYFNKIGADSELIVADINESGADVLFVCLGFPVQEKWAADNKSRFKTVRLIACLGGSVDIYAGKAKRAPKLFISLHLEWFWRLLKDPSRIKRMTSLPKRWRGQENIKCKRGNRNEMDRKTVHRPDDLQPPCPSDVLRTFRTHRRT